MPGVLWKKFDTLETATNLAFIGSIRDDILDIEELACGLLSSVRSIYPQRLLERYKLDESALSLPAYDLLLAIGAKRGMLVSGGEVDSERARPHAGGRVPRQQVGPHLAGAPRPSPPPGRWTGRRTSLSRNPPPIPGKEETDVPQNP